MKPVIAVIIILALTSLACSVNLGLPNVTRVETTEPRTLNVSEAAPDGSPAEVSIKMGAGTLNLSGGGSTLLEGTVNYNVAAWEPRVRREGNLVAISQGDINDMNGLPSKNMNNEWNLRLGDVTPVELTIDAGAYKGEVDLSGVPLLALSVTDGASDNTITFNTPNPARMSTLHYKTGASKVTLEGLANANFSRMTFDGGAGAYTLDFSGTLANDAEVAIKAGVCNVKLIVPEGMNVIISNEGAVTSISTKGTWQVTDNTYAAANGSGPTLTITVDMGVGNLELVQQ